MAEIEEQERKFKLLDDMTKCRWDRQAYLNPTPRLNSRNIVETVAESSQDPGPIAADSIPPTPAAPISVEDNDGTSGSESQPSSSQNPGRREVVGEWVEAALLHP